jgi:hypothetical protein
MKKLLFVLSLCALINIETIAQKTKTSEVLSSHIFYSGWASKTVKCFYYLEINKIEDDSVYFISIQFSDTQGGLGYVYIGNKDELDLFINDLKNSTLKINKEPFSVTRQKYKLQIENVSLQKKKIDNKIVFYEKGNDKSYLVLNVKEVDELISWLSNIYL